MSLRINHNIAAMRGHHNLLANSNAIARSLERLSSGKHINRAADDAAGLVISEQMRAQLSGLRQAIDNSETAVAMIQTAEGALDEMNSLLNKARELALHAANSGANDNTQLTADQAELDEIIASVTRIAKNTQFGTKKLLDGSLGSIASNHDGIASIKAGRDYTTLLATGFANKGYHSLQITQQATQESFSLGGFDDVLKTATGGATTLSAADHEAFFTDSFSMTINGVTIAIASGTDKGQFIQQLNAIGATAGFTATTGATITATTYGNQDDTLFTAAFAGGASGATSISATGATRVQGQGAIGRVFLYNGSVAGGTAATGSTPWATTFYTVTSTGNEEDGLTLRSIGGSVITLATALATGTHIGAIDGTTFGTTFQIGANAGQTITIKLDSMTANDLGNGGSSSFTNLQALKGRSLITGNASEALKVIDAAINDVTTTRGNLGAIQANALESTLNSLRVAHENLTAAESIIRDVDFAAESAAFTRRNILIQASTAMLAQANQLPNNMLRLLG
jgi:flagellin